MPWLVVLFDLIGSLMLTVVSLALFWFGYALCFYQRRVRKP